MGRDQSQVTGCENYRSPGAAQGGAGPLYSSCRRGQQPRPLGGGPAMSWTGWPTPAIKRIYAGWSCGQEPKRLWRGPAQRRIRQRRQSANAAAPDA